MNICEIHKNSYGGGGWAMTFGNFKRLADWEYALGVNFMNQHYANVTTEGARKFDYPDYFTGYSPWAEDYKTLNDHVARLSLVLSHGDQNNDVLILEPTSTCWMYAKHNDELPERDSIGYDFTELLYDLEHRQVEYDLASETIITGYGSAIGDKFVIGEMEYSTVIIPEHVEVLLPRTAELLVKYARKGGKIIALSRPSLVNAYENDALKSLWEKELQNISYVIDDEMIREDDITFDDCRGGNLYHHRREYEDGDLLFLANSSATESVTGHITMDGAGLKEFDTMTGEIYLYPSSKKDDDEVSFSFEIPAAGHLLLFAPKNPETLDGLRYRTIRRASDKTLTPVSPISVKRLSDNYLTLDYCSVTVDGENLGESFVADACQTLYAHFGMENPWETEVQYKQETVEADTISRGNTDIRYPFFIAEDFDLTSLKLVCERPWLWKVSVNGQSVDIIEGEHPLDARNGTFAIGQAVRKGANEITLHLDRMSVFAEIAHVFVTGDFSVIPASGHWALAAPHPLTFGSWPDQGLPFYGWTVSYSGQYDIPEPSRGYVLSLGKWEGTVTEIWVNGSKAGIVAYQPYEFDLSDYMHTGLNNIEVRCIGSLINLYGPHFVSRSDIMHPGSWYGSGPRHSCADYIFNPYGLSEPFKVSIYE